MTNGRGNRMLPLPSLRRAVLPGALLLGMVGWPGLARGQVREPAPTIASDRPGLGDGAWVMAPGVWQAELGGTIQADVGDEYLVGTALVRIGLRTLELRVFVPNLVGLHQDEGLRLGDLGVGVKVPLDLGTPNWRWAATGAFTLATGAESLTAGDPTGSVAMIGETSVTETVGFAGNVGYGGPFNDLGGGTLSLIATPTFAVPGHDGLSVYLGYAGFVRTGDDGHFVEWGLAKLDGPDRQWDVNAGYDPGDHVWFLGVGLARRWR